MTLEELRQSIARDAVPPGGLGPALEALWHDARGAWDKAHTCAQDDHSRDGAWVHAYLHRKEGDLGNARYWYSRAGRAAPDPKITLEAEWESIARDLLKC